MNNNNEADHLDTVGVAGSIPVEPTIKSTKSAVKSRGFSPVRDDSGLVVSGHKDPRNTTNCHIVCGKIAVKTRAHDHHAPCLKCQGRTPHISGVCDACRRTTCLRCKRVFIARKLGISRCGNCRGLLSETKSLRGPSASRVAA